MFVFFAPVMSVAVEHTAHTPAYVVRSQLQNSHFAEIHTAVIHCFHGNRFHFPKKRERLFRTKAFTDRCQLPFTSPFLNTTPVSAYRTTWCMASRHERLTGCSRMSILDFDKLWLHENIFLLHIYALQCGIHIMCVMHIISTKRQHTHDLN